MTQDYCCGGRWSVSNINNVDEFVSHFNSELKHFFEEYKSLGDKTLLVEEFQDADTARGKLFPVDIEISEYLR